MTATKKIIMGLAASALVATPVMAQAERATAPAAETEEAFGGFEGLSFLPLIGIVATIAGIIVLASEDDDVPVSP
jgi:hypothetical protein